MKISIVCILAIALHSYSAWANSCNFKTGMGCWECPAGGGPGDIPTPFGVYNNKVELADKEFYLLVGTVGIEKPTAPGFKSRAYLEIDHKQHPWIAHPNGRTSKRYTLEGSISFWKQYQYLKVRVSCQARGSVVTSLNGKPEYVITLAPAYDELVERWEGYPAPSENYCSKSAP